MAVAVINTLRIYERLKERFKDEEAKAVVDVIEKAFEEYRENQKEFLATKEDLANLRAELIKWMFIFWVGQFAAIVGTLTAILFAFFK